MALKEAAFEFYRSRNLGWLPSSSKIIYSWLRMNGFFLANSQIPQQLGDLPQSATRLACPGIDDHRSLICLVIAVHAESTRESWLIQGKAYWRGHEA